MPEADPGLRASLHARFAREFRDSQKTMLRNKNSSQTRYHCRHHQQPLPAASPPRAPAAPGIASGLERPPPNPWESPPQALSPSKQRRTEPPQTLQPGESQARVRRGAAGCRQPLRNPNLRGFLGNILQLHPKPCLVLLSLTLQTGLGFWTRRVDFPRALRERRPGWAGCRLSGTAAAASPRNCKTWGRLTDFSPRREKHPRARGAAGRG